MENEPKALLKHPWLPVIAVLLVILLCVVITFRFMGARTEAELGPCSDSLSGFSRLNAVRSVYGHLGEITTALDPYAETKMLEVVENDSAGGVAQRMVESGLISSAEIFVDYLVYSGADRLLMPGRYALSAAMTMPEMSERLTQHGGKLLSFAFFSGMRLEEIAALIDGSGLSFSGDEFLYAAQHYPAELHPCGGTSLEGYMLPGSYEMNRDISLDSFLAGFVNAFRESVQGPLEEAFAVNGVTLEQGVILASMVAREAPSEEEYARIASVFYNRLRAGMPFESDPTAQYAIGWDENSSSWWKSPLLASDLSVNSPYNTYQNDGFPPGPICSPSLAILRAAAFPESTPYLYFMARCDGTPLHNFSTNYAEHASNLCP